MLIKGMALLWMSHECYTKSVKSLKRLIKSGACMAFEAPL